MSTPASDRHGTAPLLVALTGGVASGKTRVSDRLAELGVPVIDTDIVARQVVAPGTPGNQRVAEAFGPEIIDKTGALDRRALRERVFASDAQRRKLESILHPLIEQETRRQIAEHDSADYVVVVVPLLVESGVFADADRVIVVDVPEAVQIDRLTKRDGIDNKQALAMLRAQASRQQRLERADYVIDNTGSIDDLQTRVDRLHRELCAEVTR